MRREVAAQGTPEGPVRVEFDFQIVSDGLASWTVAEDHFVVGVLKQETTQHEVRVTVARGDGEFVPGCSGNRLR